jgi:hypothetical protein
VRPTATYTEDNNTVFSDPSYQQQTFPHHHEFISGYDAVTPSQGKEIVQSDGTGSLFCVNQNSTADPSADRTGPPLTNVFHRV